eukprot:12390177-Ditylum_brightwellii.AAC.1
MELGTAEVEAIQAQSRISSQNVEETETKGKGSDEGNMCCVLSNDTTNLFVWTVLSVLLLCSLLLGP